MSEGDRYRDYDPKERVVELEHEVAGLRRELEEAKGAANAEPDPRIAELTKRIDELERALAKRDEKKAPRVQPRRDEPWLTLARERERLVWQLVGQWMALAIDFFLILFGIAVHSAWVLALLLGALLIAVLITGTHRKLRDVGTRLAAMEDGPRARLRVAAEPPPGDRRRWEEQEDDDAREEKGRGESKRGDR